VPTGALAVTTPVRLGWSAGYRIGRVRCQCGHAVRHPGQLARYDRSASATWMSRPTSQAYDANAPECQGRDRLRRQWDEQILPPPQNPPM